MRQWLLLGLLAVGCASNGGLGEALNELAEEIDDNCTAGKLSTAQAAAVNATPWEEPGERPDQGMNEGYCDQRPEGECVKKGDRVQNADCANAIRALRGLPATD